MDEKLRQANRDGLLRSTIRGSLWSFLGNAVRFPILLFSLMLMSRLLTPSDYGRFAIISAIANFAGTFKDMGLSVVLLRITELEQRQASSVFWFNFLCGFSIMLALILASPLVGLFYNDKHLALLIALQSVIIPISASTIIHRSLLRRRMDFRGGALADTLSMVIGTIAGFVFAVKNFGIWSLVLMSIVTEIVNSLFIWLYSPWRPSLKARWSDLAPFVMSGLHLQIVALCNVAMNGGDKLLIGGFCGPQQTGLFARAQTLLTLPLNQIMAPLANVLVPALTILSADPVKYRQRYLDGFRMISLGSSIATVVLLTNAGPIVSIFLGKQWAESARIFMFLAASSFAIPLDVAIGWLFISQGRFSDFSRYVKMNTVISLIAIAVGIPWGVDGVALSVSLFRIFIGVPVEYYYVSNNELVTWRDLARISVPCFILSMALSTIALCFTHVIGIHKLSPVYDLAYSTATSLAICGSACVLIPWTRKYLMDANSLVFNRAKRSK